MASTPADRVVSQLELALLNDCGCDRTLDAARATASEAGLSGAEIEAALGKRSFDIRTSAIVALACAMKAGDAKRLKAARIEARQLGWTTQEIGRFEGLSRAILARQLPASRGSRPS